MDPHLFLQQQMMMMQAQMQQQRALGGQPAPGGGQGAPGGLGAVAQQPPRKGGPAVPDSGYL